MPSLMCKIVSTIRRHKRGCIYQLHDESVACKKRRLAPDAIFICICKICPPPAVCTKILFGDGLQAGGFT